MHKNNHIKKPEFYLCAYHGRGRNNIRRNGLPMVVLVYIFPNVSAKRRSRYKAEVGILTFINAEPSIDE